MFIIMLHIITRRLRIIMIMLMLSPQVILKDSVGITSFGTVSRISRQCPSPVTRRPNRLTAATAFFPSCRCVPSAPAIILRDAPTVIWLQVMFEQTPTQYDIIIRNVSAAGAVVYNGSAAGNNMIGLKLQFA